MVSRHLPLTSFPPTVHVCPSSGLPEYPGAHLSNTRKTMCSVNILGRGGYKESYAMGQWGRKEEVCERWYIRWIVPLGESSQPKADVNHETKDHRVIKTSNTSFFHYSIHWATVHLLNIHLTKVHPAYLLTTNSFPTGKKRSQNLAGVGDGWSRAAAQIFNIW